MNPLPLKLPSRGYKTGIEAVSQLVASGQRRTSGAALYETRLGVLPQKYSGQFGKEARAHPYRVGDARKGQAAIHLGCRPS
jgi:hypothetical protein